jgi:hypothetical protein
LTANASNAVAVIPGHLTAALADRRQLPALDRSLVIMTSTASPEARLAPFSCWLRRNVFLRDAGTGADRTGG